MAGQNSLPLTPEQVAVFIRNSGANIALVDAKVASTGVQAAVENRCNRP